MANLPDLEDPLTRGIAWVTLWDGVLEGEISPSAWFELLLSGLTTETVEQNTQRILGYLGTTFWAFLDDDRRLEIAPRVEGVLWSAIAESGTPTLKAAYFRAWRRVVRSRAGLERMRRIWAEEEDVPGVRLSEPDFTALAEGLAVRGVAGGEEILDRQAGRIENTDRLARFTFVRPALSADPKVREAFFQGLADPANREREPWVLSAVSYLHHPLRVAHAGRFIRPSLEMVVEIQRTGDIFFPSGWLDATLGGHSSVEAADTVRAFLNGVGSDYPPRLRGKILQSADRLFRVRAFLRAVTEIASGPLSPRSLRPGATTCAARCRSVKMSASEINPWMEGGDGESDKSHARTLGGGGPERASGHLRQRRGSRQSTERAADVADGRRPHRAHRPDARQPHSPHRASERHRACDRLGGASHRGQRRHDHHRRRAGPVG